MLHATGVGELALLSLKYTNPEAYARYAEAARQARANAPAIPASVPLVGGTSLADVGDNLVGLAATGPFFPLAGGLQVAGKGIEQGRPPLEALASGATTGLGLAMGGKVLGKLAEAASFPRATPQIGPDFTLRGPIGLGEAAGRTLSDWFAKPPTPGAVPPLSIRREAAQVLGVDRNATPEEVKAARDALAMKFHPDVNPAPDAPGIMARINQAFEVLSNPELRPSPARLFSSIIPLPPPAVQRLIAQEFKITSAQVRNVARAAARAGANAAQIAANLKLPEATVAGVLSKLNPQTPEQTAAPQERAGAPAEPALAVEAVRPEPGAAEAAGRVEGKGPVAAQPPVLTAQAPVTKQPWEMKYQEWQDANPGRHQRLYHEAVQSAVAAEKPVSPAVLTQYRGQPWADAALAKAGEGGDLLGQAVKSEVKQRPLWGERGVEATWQTVGGVDYVLTPDGQYATRADGTGALIPKEDVAGIAADAAKARPPATEAPGLRRAGAEPPASRVSPTVPAGARALAGQAEAMPPFPGAAGPTPTPKQAPTVTAAAPPEKPPVEPPAPPAAVPAPEPGPTIESQRVLSYLDRIPASQLANAAGTMYAKGEPALSRVPSIASAATAVRRAGRYLAEVRRRASGMIKDYQPDVPSTPLLTWLRNTPIAAWKPSEGWAEIRDMAEGRPGAKEIFAFQQTGRGAARARPLDLVVEDAGSDPVSGFTGTTPSELLDRIGQELDERAETSAAGTDLLSRLEGAARVERPENADELRHLADMVRDAEDDVETARKALLEKLKPYLTTTEGKESELAKELRRLAAEADRAKAEVVSAKAEVVGAKAETVATKAEAAKERERLRTQLKSTVTRLRAAAKSRAASIEDYQKRLSQILKPLPLNERGKLLSRVRTATTPTTYASALEQAADYYERGLKRGAIRRIGKIVQWFNNHKAEFDPADTKDAAILKQVRMLKASKKSELMKDELGDLENTLTALREARHEHKIARILLGAEEGATVEDAQRDILAENNSAIIQPPKAPANLEMPTQMHLGQRVALEMMHMDTVSEFYFGGREGRFYKLFFEAPVIDGDLKYGGVFYGVKERLNVAAGQASGGKLESEKHIRWMLDPQAFTLPDAGKITMSRDAAVDLYNLMGDEDAYARLWGSGEWPSYVPAENRTAPAKRMTERDADEFRHQFMQDQKALGYADALSDVVNDAEHFAALDKTHFDLKGTHITKTEARRYWSTEYNVRVEKTQGAPDVVAEYEDWVMKVSGRYTARLPGGRRVSFVLRSATQRVLQNTVEDAAYIGYALPIRNGFSVMGLTMELPGEVRPITTQAYLERKYGKSLPDNILGHLRHIMASRHLAPTPFVMESDPERWLDWLTRNAVSAAVGANIAPVGTQLIQSIFKTAGVRGLSIENYRKGLAAAFFDKAKKRHALDVFKKHAAALQFRWDQHAGAAFALPEPQTQGGYSAKWGRRIIEKAVGKSGWLMTWMDEKTQIGTFLGYEEQLAAAGLRGDALEKEAARQTYIAAITLDSPVSPGARSGVSRAARRNQLIRALTPYQEGANQALNQAMRDYAHGKRTGNWKYFAYTIGLLVTFAAAYEGQKKLLFWRRTGKEEPMSLGGAAKSMTGTLAQNVYGGGALADLLMAKNSYQADLRGPPVVSAIENIGKGLVGLRTAAEKKNGEQAIQGFERLLKGSAWVFGLNPSEGLYIARYLRQSGKGPQPKSSVGGMGRAGGKALFASPPWASTQFPQFPARFGARAQARVQARAQRKRGFGLTRNKPKRKLSQWANPPWMKNV